MAALALVPNATLFASFGVGVAVSLLQALPVLLLKRWPAGAAAMAAAVAVLASFLAPSAPVPWSAAGILVGVVALASASARYSDRAAAGCVAVFAAVASLAVFRHGMPAAAFAGCVAFLSVVVLMVRLVVRLRETSDRLREERHWRALEEVRRAADEERAALAARVHDAVGHHLAIISLTASSEVGRASAQADKDSALAEVASYAAAALSEIRSVLDEASDRHTGSPGATENESLRDLADQWTAVGVRVEHEGLDLVDTGSPRLRGEAYRVARQAITNAVQHGAGKEVCIVAEREGASVRLLISNPADGTETVPGRGLAGMRERLEKDGHRLELRCADGRFELEAVLSEEG